MEILISPGSLHGTVRRVIASKSQSHRALICAALSDQPTALSGMAFSVDVDATCSCLRALGSRIMQAGDTLTVFPGRPGPDPAVLDCAESGSTLRFLLPVAAALGADAAFTGRGKLAQRPLSPLWEQMTAHGAVLSAQGQFLLRCRGTLRGGHYEMAGNVSSQFFSGLMMALPLTGEESEVRVTGRLESAPYLDLTLQTMEAFGVQVLREEGAFRIPGGQHFRSPSSLRIEADWSGAAFWLAAGALSDEGVSCEGLNLRSAQGDREIVSLLRGFGARVTEGESSVRVQAAPMRGLDIDAADIPDLVPVLAVVAACARGDTRIRHIRRLRLKESDRIASVLGLLQALGGKAEASEDEMIIHGRETLTGGTVNACGDHRIVMSAAVAAGRTERPVLIPGAEASDKSYPGFFEQFRALGGIFIAS